MSKKNLRFHSDREWNLLRFTVSVNCRCPQDMARRKKERDKHLAAAARWRETTFFFQWIHRRIRVRVAGAGLRACAMQLTDIELDFWLCQLSSTGCCCDSRDLETFYVYLNFSARCHNLVDVFSLSLSYFSMPLAGHSVNRENFIICLVSLLNGDRIERHQVYEWEKS